MCTAEKKQRSPSQPTGQWIRTESRLAIYLRDRFTCLLCLRDLHDAAPSDITLDHITPRSTGGGNTPDNLYTCCRACNCSRQDKPLARVAGPEARAHIRRNAARGIKRYRMLAKAILAGELEYDADLVG